MPARDDARTIRVPYNVTVLVKYGVRCRLQWRVGAHWRRSKYIYIHLFIVSTIRSDRERAVRRVASACAQSLSRDLEPSSRYLMRVGKPVPGRPGRMHVELRQAPSR